MKILKELLKLNLHFMFYCHAFFDFIANLGWQNLPLLVFDKGNTKL